MTITELYYELSKIYSCKYADKKEEMDECYNVLYEAVINQKVPVESIIEKMKKLRAKLTASGDFESKLSAQILNRFWEKDFSGERVVWRKFRPD